MRRFLVRWGETALTALGAAVLLWQGGRLVLWGGWLGWWFGWLLLVGGAGAALWCFAAWQRARLRRGGHGPGFVTIEERRIAFWGPEGGGFAEIDDLERVDLGPGPEGPTWVLAPEFGVPLAIPAAADGADRLADALTALPGFSAGIAADALGAGGARLTIWRRPRPALARPSPPV